MSAKPARVLERGLPQNVDAERFILASILMGGSERYTAAASVLEPDDFALDTHQIVFRVMRELDGSGSKVERVHVAEFLDRKNLTEQIPISFLMDLEEGIPRIPDISGYLRLVKDKSTLRKTIFACRAIANRCIAADEDSQDVLHGAERMLAQLSSDSADPSRWFTPSQVIREHPGGLDSFISPSRGGVGIAFPWASITDATCGMQSGDMLVLAARPSMGKTAAALQIADCAVKKGHLPAYVSLEMTKESLVRRLLSSKASVDAQRMRAGFMNPEERHRVNKTLLELDASPIWIDDSRNRTAEGIRQSLKRRAAAGPIGLIIVDHFHLVRGHRGQEPRERYNDIADAIQGWGKEFNCPTLTLAQLNRDCEKENRSPGLTDLKETGKLEENADVVMFVHRPEMYARNRGREELRGQAQLILGKQRNGPTGAFRMVWLSGMQTFEQEYGGEMEGAE